MKRMLTFLILVFAVFTCVAQINWRDYSQTMMPGLSDKPTALGLIVCIAKDNNSFWTNGMNERYFENLITGPSFSQQHAKNIIARTTFDTAAVHFFFHGIDARNVSDFQFRVIEYPSRIVEPWQPLLRFTDAATSRITGLPKMAYLGGYKAKLSNMLIIDVRDVRSNRIVASSVIAWVPIVPIVSNIYTSDTFDAFLQRLQYPWSNKANQLAGSASSVIRKGPDNINFIYFIKAEIYNRRQLQYELSRGNQVIIPWKNNDYDNSFVWLKQQKSGNYELKLRYTAQPGNVAAYHFEITPAWYQGMPFKIAACLLLAAVIGSFIFILLLIRQRKLTRQVQSKKMQLQLSLKAIHAQLNPHFVFNALSSIQGLINVQDLHGANTYLADFAKLMRESLRSGDQILIPLEREILFLETYLKLEKLRFGFTYEITRKELIPTNDISVPPLLLQPLVENAVKHGVSCLQEKGFISIYITQKKQHLLIVINDNGHGYDSAKDTEGFGVKLTRDRIQLLNELYPGRAITLETVSGSSGTAVKILFNNLF